jgi:ketosteroid isomerase-like protein
MESAERRRELVELTRRGFEAYTAGDMETVLARLAPDVVLESTMGNVGTFHGHEGFLEWTREWLDVWEEFRVEVREVVPVGDDHAIVEVDQSARGRGGIEVSQRPAFAYEADADLHCTRMALCADRDEAFAKVREWGAPTTG